MGYQTWYLKDEVQEPAYDLNDTTGPGKQKPGYNHPIIP